MKRKKFLLLNFMLLGLSHVFGADYFHIVKNGETLSGILSEKNLKPIYGNLGTLKLIQKLNPHLTKNKGNKIYPGQKIILVKKKLEMEVTLPAKSNSTSQILAESIPSDTQMVNDKRNVSHSDLILSFTSRFIKVESTDNRTNGQATLLSDSGIGYHLSWGQSWSDKFHTHLDFEKYQVHILDSSSTTSSLENTTQSLSSYMFGGEYKLNSKFKFASSINYGETIVFRAENSSSIVVEKFISAKMNNGLIYTMLSHDHLKLISAMDLVLALPSKQETYSSKLSYGFNFGLWIEDQFSILGVKGGFFYKTLDFKMNESNFKQSEVGVMIGLSKNFGQVH